MLNGKIGLVVVKFHQMPKKKKTFGKIIGERIDGGIGKVASLFSAVAAKPGHIKEVLSAENDSIANRAQVREILKGYGSGNLKREEQALDFMHENNITPEMVNRMMRS